MSAMFWPINGCRERDSVFLTPLLPLSAVSGRFAISIVGCRRCTRLKAQQYYGGGRVIRPTIDQKTHLFPSFYIPYQVLITMYPRNSARTQKCVLSVSMPRVPRSVRMPKYRIELIKLEYLPHSPLNTGVCCVSEVACRHARRSTRYERSTHCRRGAWHQASESGHFQYWNHGTSSTLLYGVTRTHWEYNHME